MQLNTILIPTDGSSNVYSAVDAALELAKMTGATVKAVYVVDREPGLAAPDIQLCDIVNEASRKEAEDAFAAVKIMADKAGVEYSQAILTGDPADAIIAESANNDMIVMTTVGKSGLKKALMGSVSQKVIARAKCPVMVTKPNKE